MQNVHFFHKLIFSGLEKSIVLPGKGVNSDQLPLSPFPKCRDRLSKGEDVNVLIIGMNGYNQSRSNRFKSAESASMTVVPAITVNHSKNNASLIFG